MTKVLALIAVAIALLATYAGLTQASSLVLRGSAPLGYWPRHGTVLTGRYRRDRGWVYASGPRAVAPGFTGGGPSAGK